jgi:hypothetical protein
MLKCTLKDSCRIGNGDLANSTEVIAVMMDHFCNDRFTKCSVYKAAILDVEASGEGTLSGGAMKWFISDRI